MLQWGEGTLLAHGDCYLRSLTYIPQWGEETFINPWWLLPAFSHLCTAVGGGRCTYLWWLLPAFSHLFTSLRGGEFYLPMVITTCLLSPIYHSGGGGRGLVLTHGNYYLPSLTYSIKLSEGRGLYLPMVITTCFLSPIYLSEERWLYLSIVITTCLLSFLIQRKEKKAVVGSLSGIFSPDRDDF